jgi:hypothetical protein
MRPAANEALFQGTDKGSRDGPEEKWLTSGTAALEILALHPSTFAYCA